MYSWLCDRGTASNDYSASVLRVCDLGGVETPDALENVVAQMNSRKHPLTDRSAAPDDPADRCVVWGAVV